MNSLDLIQYCRTCKPSENFSTKSYQTTADPCTVDLKPTDNKLPFLVYHFPHCAAVLIHRSFLQASWNHSTGANPNWQFVLLRRPHEATRTSPLLVPRCIISPVASQPVFQDVCFVQSTRQVSVDLHPK